MKSVRRLLPAALILICAGGAYAAGDGHAGTPMLQQVGKLFNTVVLIGILVYFVGKPLMNFFSERRAQIQKDLDDAKAQRAKAEELLKEYESKMAGMEAELGRMRAELKKSADVEAAKVAANAERMAAAMIESAKLTAEQEVRKAKVELKQEAVALAVEMAEAVIREQISEQDRRQLVEDYFVKVGGMK
jgi:F-type H+-transporting ATPase subunit b